MTTASITTCSTIAASEARRHFGRLLDTSQRKPVIIERRGRPVSVVISKHDYDQMQAQLAEARGWAETRYLLSTEANRRHLMDSIAEVERGEVIEKTMEELRDLASAGNRERFGWGIRFRRHPGRIVGQGD